jgi:septation ring formation regulator EzrA
MDQELVQYLDEQFGGVNRRFEQIDRRFEQVNQRFGQIDRRFEQIDQRFGQIDRRFEGVDGQIKGLRQEMREGQEEVKRHFGVLAEDLHYQVRLVAEGFATFVEGRYTQDQARIDERFRETHALIRSSYDYLNQRVENLERKSQG